MRPDELGMRIGTNNKFRRKSPLRKKVKSDDSRNTHEQWIARETQAEEMIPLIGKLNRENGVVLNIHGRRPG